MKVEMSSFYGSSAASESNRKLNSDVLGVKKDGIKDNVFISWESKNASQAANRAEKQQKSKEKKEKNDYSKALTIASRIRKGGKVPSADERFLLQFDLKMYILAKLSAVTAERADKKKYESILDKDEDGEENGDGNCVESANGETDLSLDVNSFADMGAE
jgi:hypothetical protein